MSVLYGARMVGFRSKEFGLHGLFHLWRVFIIKNRRFFLLNSGITVGKDISGCNVPESFYVSH